MKAINLIILVVVLVIFSKTCFAELEWVSVKNGNMPANLIQGGWENGGEKQLPVCRAYHGSDLIPGKVVSGSCNYGWGGKELSTKQFDVLTSIKSDYSWERYNSFIPKTNKRIFAGGKEGNKELYVGRTKHRKDLFREKGMHVGKLLDGKLSYGYGGEEYVVDSSLLMSFGVLVDMSPFSLSSEDEKTINAIIEDVDKRWIDQHGFLRLNPVLENDRSSDNENPTLFTSEYLYCLKKLGVLKGELRQRYKTKIKEMINGLRLEPGLFNRTPGQSDSDFNRHFSRDEQIGLITLDYVFDWELGFAKELYDYGKNNEWVYENRTWSKKGIHERKAYHKGKEISGVELRLQGQRTPKFIGLVKAANNKKPSVLDIGEISIGIKITMDRPKEKTSGKILAFLRLEILQGKDDDLDKMISKFYSEMRNIYGINSLHGLMKIYYINSEHPLRKLSKFLTF